MQAMVDDTRMGQHSSRLAPETQFLLVAVEEGGPYAVLLPLIDSNTFRGTLRPPRCASLVHMQVADLQSSITYSVMVPLCQSSTMQNKPHVCMQAVCLAV